MFDSIKILLEEPQKILKGVLILLKNILITIFAIAIYKWFFGNYMLIDFFSLNQWINFILSGQVLICVFCYVLSYVVLFSLVPAVIEGIVYLFINKDYPIRMSKSDQKLALKVLSALNIISFNDELKKGNHKLKEGKYTDEFINFLTSIQQKEIKDEISSLKKSFLNDIVHVFVASVIVYYFFIAIPPITKWFHFIIFSAGFLMVGTYIVINRVFEYVIKNSDQFLFILHALKTIGVIESTLLECGIYVYDIADHANKGYIKGFNFKEEEYIWEPVYEKNKITSYKIKRYNELCNKTGHKILLTTNVELSETAKGMLSPKIFPIIFTSKEDLKSQLSELFQEK